MSLSVAIVDAETPGNVGTVARSMKNFGVTDLKLVDPPPLEPDGEAYGFAGHAREDVLPNAQETTLDRLVEAHHTVACTATTNEDARSHVRYPFVEPAALADELRDVAASTCLVFGRESDGLTNAELARMDRVCSVPASADYPVLNLGQAATVVLYELRELTVDGDQHPDAIERADEAHLEGVHDQFARFLDAVNHPEERRHKARRLFRRVTGRTHLTPREATTLRGLFRKGADLLEHPERLQQDG